MTNLIDYLPQFLKEYEVLENILNVQNEFLEQMQAESNLLFQNSFVKTANEQGIKRFEQMLKIKPFKSDTIETRRERVLMSLDQNLPYTLEVLIEKIRNLIGDKFNYDLSYVEYFFKIVSTLDSISKIKILEDLIDEHLPANLIIESIATVNYINNFDNKNSSCLVFTQKYKLI